MNLKCFTQPEILEHIGSRRLEKLLNAFSEDLETEHFTLPTPDSQNGIYFDSLATTLASDQKIPDRLRNTLLALEAAALPENDTHLSAAIQRRIPTVAVSQTCVLDRALELWFHAPEELSRFSPPNHRNTEEPPTEAPLLGPACQHVSVSAFSPSSESACAAFKPNFNPQSSILSPSSYTPFPEAPSSTEVPENRNTKALKHRNTETPVPEAVPGSKLPTPSSESAWQNVSVSAFSPSSLLPAAGSAACSDADAFSRLAQLSISEYDRARRSEAKRLHLRLATLDAEVGRCRSQINDDAQANAVTFPTIEPWPTPVLGAPELFHQVAARYTNYIILPPGAADAMALFTGHCHAFTAFYQTPRLNLYSPRRGCGKTTTMDVLATMVPRPFRTENMRAAVLFRVVDQKQPTLLLDEVDTYLHQADELRGLLNAGNKRGACAYRCEGAGNAIRAFKAFAPAVLAGIGELPATLHDRSILIRLVPAGQGQVPARFNEHHTELEKALASKLGRWAKDNYEALAACDPVLPSSAFNRLADNWRPLFAVAEVVGGDWPQRAAAAFAQLTTHRVGASASIAVTNGQNHEQSDDDSRFLFSAIRDIFAQAGVTRMFSQELVASLRISSTLDTRYSPALAQLNPVRLARRLSAFGVYPRLFRIGHARGKGYELADFNGHG